MEQYDAYLQDKRRTFWDKTWRDRHGKVVLWQMPNVWLIVWVIGTTVSLFLSGLPSDVLFWIASACLVIWSFLEIFRGANHFRRVLGLVVLIYAIASMIQSL